MASPTLYTLSYDFTSFQASNPTSPLPADKVEIELQNVATTTSEIITNLDLIQKTDGTLTNGIVTTEALASNVLALLTSGYTIEGDWVTSTSYALNDLVTINNASYICIVAHTSGTFATDLSSGNWFLIATNGGVTATVTDIGNITPTDGVLLVGDGATWVAESGSTLRTSMGLGSGDTPQFDGLNIGAPADTTLTRVSAGVIAIEGSNVLLASNIGVSVQAYDAALASISGLSTSADKMIYATSANTYAVTSLTAVARSFLDDSSVSAQRTTLDVYSTSEVDAAVAAIDTSDWELVDSGTITEDDTTVDFDTDEDGYDYKCVIPEYQLKTTTTDIELVVTTDAFVSVKTGASDYMWGHQYYTSGGHDYNDANIQVNTTFNWKTLEPAMVEFIVRNPVNSSITSWISGETIAVNTSPTVILAQFSGRYKIANTINGVRFRTGAAMQSGSWKLYRRTAQ